MTGETCACAIPDTVVNRIRRDVALSVCGDRVADLTVAAGFGALVCAGTLIAATFVVSGVLAVIAIAGFVLCSGAFIASAVACNRAWSRLEVACQDLSTAAVVEVWRACASGGESLGGGRLGSASLRIAATNDYAGIRYAQMRHPEFGDLDSAFTDLVFAAGKAAWLHDSSRTFLGGLCARPSDRELIDAGVFAMLGCYAADERMLSLWHNTRAADEEGADAVGFDRVMVLGVSASRAHTSTFDVDRALHVRALTHSHSSVVVTVAEGLAAHRRYQVTPDEVFELAYLVCANAHDAQTIPPPPPADQETTSR